MLLLCFLLEFFPTKLDVSLKLVSVPTLGKALALLKYMTLLSGSCRSSVFIVRYTGPELEMKFFQFNTRVGNWKRSFDDDESCSLEQHPAGPYGLYLRVTIHRNLPEFCQYCSFIFFSFRSTLITWSMLVSFCSFVLLGCNIKHQ